MIAVAVDTTRHGSRWYPGAGIYRKVQMITTDAVHVAPWGTCVRTPEVSDQAAEIQIQTVIGKCCRDRANANTGDQHSDPSGKSVATLKTETPNLPASDKSLTRRLRYPIR